MGKNTWKRKWNENELNKEEKDNETIMRDINATPYILRIFGELWE